MNEDTRAALVAYATLLVAQATNSILDIGKLPPNPKHLVDSLYYTARVEAINELVLPFISEEKKPLYHAQLTLEREMTTMFREHIKEWANPTKDQPTPPLYPTDTIRDI